MTLKGTTLAALAAAGLAMLSAPAMAISTWNLSSCAQSGSSAGNSYTGCSSGSGSPTAVANAFSTTGSGSAFATATLASYSGGFGVTAAGESTNSPQHSMDNSSYTDAILLSFSSSVILKQLTIGWAAYDSDFTLLRYTGSSAPAITGKSMSTLLTSGWSAVGSYMNTMASPAQNDNGTTANATATVNSGGLSSSWWLISAYNSSYNAPVFGGSADSNSDYVKLLSVAGDKQTTTTAVPEPGSIALVAAALGGLWISRRRLAKVSLPRLAPALAA